MLPYFHFLIITIRFEMNDLLLRCCHFTPPFCFLGHFNFCNKAQLKMEIFQFVTKDFHSPLDCCCTERQTMLAIKLILNQNRI